MEEKKIGILMKVVANKFTQKLDAKSLDTGLTGTQAHLIMYLNEHSNEEMNPCDIERAFKASKPTISGLISRLIEKELVTYQESEKNHRYKQVLLTQKGYDMVPLLKEHVTSVERQLSAHISENELASTRLVLEQMIKNLSKEEEE